MEVNKAHINLEALKEEAILILDDPNASPSDKQWASEFAKDYKRFMKNNNRDVIPNESDIKAILVDSNGKKISTSRAR